MGNACSVCDGWMDWPDRLRMDPDALANVIWASIGTENAATWVDPYTAETHPTGAGDEPGHWPHATGPMSVLHLAIEYANVEAVRKLVALGADVAVCHPNVGLPLYVLALANSMDNDATPEEREVARLVCAAPQLPRGPQTINFGGAPAEFTAIHLTLLHMAPIMADNIPVAEEVGPDGAATAHAMACLESVLDHGVNPHLPVREPHPRQADMPDSLAAMQSPIEFVLARGGEFTPTPIPVFVPEVFDLVVRRELWWRLSRRELRRLCKRERDDDPAVADRAGSLLQRYRSRRAAHILTLRSRRHAKRDTPETDRLADLGALETLPADVLALVVAHC
jgi:hypothetical protein